MSCKVMDVKKQFIVHYPLGHTMVNGAMISNHDVATNLLRELEAGNSVAVPLFENGWRVNEVDKLKKRFYSLRTFRVQSPESEWESYRCTTLDRMREVAEQRSKETNFQEYNHRIVEVTEREVV